RPLRLASPLREVRRYSGRRTRAGGASEPGGRRRAAAPVAAGGRGPVALAADHQRIQPDAAADDGPVPSDHVHDGGTVHLVAPGTGGAGAGRTGTPAAAHAGTERAASGAGAGAGPGAA